MEAAVKAAREAYPEWRNTPPAAGAATPAIRAKARGLEETVKARYLRAAESSEGLMADLLRLFRKIARKRGECLLRLK